MQPSFANSSLEPRPVARPLTFTRALPAEPAFGPTLCSTCRLRRLCLPGSMQTEDTKVVDELVYTRRRLHSGEHLFRAGDRFESLYAFRAGSFKSYLVTRDGRTQVTGFPMSGDLAGMDGMGSGTHTQSLVALETGEACILPYARLQDLSRRLPALQHQVNRVMSCEIVRQQRVMTVLATLPAEAKVADFLVSLARRFAARGYSSTEFNLRMTRSDIGSYLGLKFETVSRAFSKLQRTGGIRANSRSVAITNRELLGQMTLDETDGMTARLALCRPRRRSCVDRTRV
jgi:CRP/FNR family transcriptional regulator, anaerobic regulatory protein